MVVRHSCLSLSLTLAMRDAEPFGVESALYLSGLDETIGGKSSTSHEKVRPHLALFKKTLEKASGQRNKPGTLDNMDE
jgi:hypothetical protein